MTTDILYSGQREVTKTGFHILLKCAVVSNSTFQGFID
nr:MAG TPA_asm: hypothetical protein [Caudoviricetes sp.]